MVQVIVEKEFMSYHAAEIWDCPVLEKSQRVGDWVVDQFVGRGGFGAIYGVRHVKNKSRRAVVKIFCGDMRGDTRKGARRIAKEADLIKKLGSLSAPQIYAVGKLDDKRPYFVMEVLDAYSIDTLPESSDEIREFVLGVIQALRTLHTLGKRGWVHRDLKPENIARRISDGRIVLIDFGSASPMDKADAEIHVPRAKTENSNGRQYYSIGTKGYEPPELLFRPCCDIFALGRVIRDCFKRDVPVVWSLVINKCISSRPEYRYRDLDELEHDVLHIDAVGRAEMKTCIYDDRVKNARQQTALMTSPEVLYSWIRLKSELGKAQKADESVYAGEGQVFVDFNVLSDKHVRLTRPLTLKTDRIIVVKGPGVLEGDIDALLSDEYVEDFSDNEGLPALVVLLDNATLVNTSRKAVKDQHISYLVGDSCYLNFKNLQHGEKEDADRVVVSNLGFAFVCYSGPDTLLELLQRKDKRIAASIPPIYTYSNREVFFDPDTGEVALDGLTIKNYLEDNDIYRKVMGMLVKCVPDQ